jgi:DNA-binding MarR family transcriptional regulator
MSFTATKWAWKQRGLTAPQKLVLLRLAEQAKEATLVCWPGQLHISDFTGLKERTVRGALKVLETRGLISRKKRGNGAYRTSDLTTLLVTSSNDLASKNRRATDTKSGDNPSGRPAGDAGANRQQVPVASGTRCRIISHDEPPRQNPTSPVPKVMLPLMPENARPDIDLHNRAVEFATTLRADLDGHIDWAAPGIEDPSRLERWLENQDEAILAAKILGTVRRRGNRPSSPIRSWKYFEKEVEPEK